MKKFIKVAAGFCVVLGLAGCGTSNDGPPSHTVKKMLSNTLYNDVLKLGRMNVQADAPMFGESPSAHYLERQTALEKFEKHKDHYLHKFEDSMQEKGCTKAGDATYNCSVIMENAETKEKSTFIVTIGKAGNVWSLSGVNKTS